LLAVALLSFPTFPFCLRNDCKSFLIFPNFVRLS
jgi:hypothetical protein